MPAMANPSGVILDDCRRMRAEINLEKNTTSDKLVNVLGELPNVEMLDPETYETV